MGELKAENEGLRLAREELKAFAWARVRGGCEGTGCGGQWRATDRATRTGRERH